MDVTKEVTQAEAKSEDAIELWFFRDLSDGQRGSLIYLVLGDKIAGEATNHGLQRVCLKRIIQQIRETALTTAQSEAAELRKEVERLRMHVNHMANWITRANKGVKQGPYSFEGLGEDMAALDQPK